MKKRSVLIGAALAVIPLGACIWSVAVAKVPEPTWFEVGRNRGFIAFLPGRADLDVHDPVASHTSELYHYTSQELRRTYGVSRMELPPDRTWNDREAVLDELVKMLVKLYEGKLSWVKPISLGDHPGRAFELTCPPGVSEGHTFRMWLYLGESSAFRQIIEVEPGSAEIPEDRRFVDSFRITGS
ncbi:MAG TPA: hypothetical protein VFF73_01290 [Planctomycetota bacterium]|nr:hypothetical protein [Planctomycetota bacterium]